MADRIVLDGELSLNNLLDGEVGLMSLIEVGISEIRFNSDYTITFVMTDGRTFTSEPVRGADGAQGEKGDKGDKGDTGDDYILTQQDKEDIAGLVDIPVDDVQIDGTSIVTDRVAEIPIASANDFGTVKVRQYTHGLFISSEDNTLRVQRPTSSQIKGGTEGSRPIVPYCQHEAVFYGLAKAAGDTTQSTASNYPIGTYTENAKTAIRTMLGIDKDSLIAEIRDALNL